ncbi:MAG TPA: hypothetical protein VFB06_15735 [Streptosporangiaceae bacterium]|nr:hypothetical protein [Streptosporangiaceae bacterium]
MPRRARYLVPRGLPRRGEFIAACAVLLVLAHAVFAQLTLVVAVVCYLIGKLTRWRSQWLLAPAMTGLVWTLAAGPRVAAAGFAAGPAHILGYLSAPGHELDHVLRPVGAYAGASGWLFRQLPLALLAGCAEAGLALWLSWLHTDEWDLPRPRPGLLLALRRLLLIRRIRGGGLVTRDGACLGIAPDDGARVGLSWSEVSGGVLVCGSVAPDPLITSFQLVHAALRRRKPVLTVDLTADPAVPRLLAGACAAAGIPLRAFGVTVPGAQAACYDPFRLGPPSHRAELVAGMLSWDGAASQHRRGCVAYLEDVFELLDAAPGDPRVPVLDEVLHLLNPGALRARARHVPDVYARRVVLAERTGVSASLIDAEPATTARLAAGLRALRASEAGRWLRQPVGGQLSPIDLGQVVSSRTAALFRVAPAADAAANGAAANGTAATPDCGAMLTRLVCHDLLALDARLRGIGVDGDGLVWLTGCEALDEQTLAALIAAGAAAGLPVVATTSATRAAAELAELPNALVVHRVSEPGAARRLAAVAAPRLLPAAGRPASGPASGQLAGGPVPAGPVPAGPVPAGPVPAGPLSGGPQPAPVPVPGHGPGQGVEVPAVVSAEDIATLGEAEFVLAVARPRRIVPRALAVRPRELTVRPRDPGRPG